VWQKETHQAPLFLELPDQMFPKMTKEGEPFWWIAGKKMAFPLSRACIKRCLAAFV